MTRSSVLVTGGAGYIGAHVAHLLRQRDVRIVVLDDLSTGRAERLTDAPLVRADLASSNAVETLEAVFEAHDVGAVVHLAGKKQVAESVTGPTRYFRQNVGGLTNLLTAMERRAVRRLVFSSSAAVYGATERSSVREDHDTRPLNPYGQTKLVGEWMNRAASDAWGLSVANLRYFNVAGSAAVELRDGGRTNLIPIVLDAARAGSEVPVFGSDWQTVDGTCVRDYIDVRDLAAAHVDALEHVAREVGGPTEFNIGTGIGTSVRQVIALAEAVSGREIRTVDRGPRPGDPAAVVADPTLANEVLGWRARYSTAETIASAWEHDLRGASRVGGVLAA
ncbi:UDP-glucose 4-epimerase GalE [Curtobacterium sp. PsM8]|uniref:UDP-glucose 4-epimerase GalE n=1 Tax=Curtobacterium sp. PsM8 TaxID=3030532 RepID=UPI00263AD504|nr:UDP-glucose 4-epimerase GalE [Curtobacterium sp. PsM8]MDN4649335.1 UDP-glucose 4-epimerase GalE [Curtobacterium sp. PsM8]